MAAAARRRGEADPEAALLNNAATCGAEGSSGTAAVDGALSVVVAASVASAAVLVAGLLGLSAFLGAQWVSMLAFPGFTGGQLLGLVAWMYLAPLSAVIGLAATLAAIKGGSLPLPARVAVPLLVSAGSLSLAVWAGHEAREVLQCGVLFCVGRADIKSKDANGARGTYGTGLLIVAGGLGLAVWVAVCRMMLASRPAEARQPVLRNLSQRIRSRRLQRVAAGGALALLVLPFCFVLTAVLPNSFEFFHVTGGMNNIVAQAAAVMGTFGHPAAEYPHALMKTQNWRWSHNVVLKLYPDTVMFYGYLELLAITAVIAAAHPPFGRLLRRTLHVGPYSFSLGECLAGAGLAVLLVLWTVYWLHDHTYHNGKPGIDDSNCDRVARYFGLTSTLFMSLALLPATKNSLWLTALGVSWESSVWVHRCLGGATLIAALCHILAFWVRFNQLGIFPHDVLAFVTYYPMNGPKPQNPKSDNWTIPLMELVGYPSILCLGLPPLFRRKNWEIFKYFHYFFLALIPTTLIHGTNAWYFMLGGVAFWLVDAGVRFVGVTEPTPLLSVATHPAEGGVTELRFQKSFSEPGQYCFIQVPAVSTWEWHPFSLCSSPLDGVAQMCIKNMGAGTFTGRLYELAQRSAREGARFVVNVDGPYGPPLDPLDHEGILLLAGGIGVTPIHSTFRMLSQLSVRRELPNTLRLVRFVWIGRTPELFRILSSSVQECLDLAAQNEAVRLEAIFYLDNPAAQSAGEVPPALPVGIQLRRGRPNIGELYDAILADCSSEGTVLAQACGPPPMTISAEKAAKGRRRLVFESELFSL